MAARQSRLVAVVALLVLAGCGGGEDKPDATPRQSEAVTKAVEAARGETMQVRITRSGTIPNEGDYSFEGEGSVQGDGKRGFMKGDLVALDGSELDLEVRFEGDDTWAAAPQLQLPRGARWLHSDEVLIVDRALAPWNMLDIMKAAYDISEASSQKEVEGEPADHYRGVADIETLRKTVPELAISGNPNERVPIEMWLADGRPRRLLIDFDNHSVAMRYDAVVLGFEDEKIPGPPPAGTVIEADEAR